MSEGGIEAIVDEIDELIIEGDLDEADERLTEAMREHGQAPRLLVLQAELALEEDDLDGCVAAAEQALENIEDDEWRGRLLELQGYAHYYLDDLEKSRQAFNDSVRADPENYGAIVGRAMVHEHVGYFHAARLDLDRAIELDDQEAQPYAIRGSILLRFGDVDEAQTDLEYAVDFDPWDEESRLNLARIHALNGETATGIEVLEPLVEEGEDPDLVAPGAILRAQLSLQLGSVDAALEDAEVAAEMLPDEPWAYLQMAAAHIQAQVDPGRAIEALKQAKSRVADERDLPDLSALYAAAYDQLGKTDKAARLREEVEGVARLPGFVYGPLNPAQNIPINPNKPIDIRSLLDDLFGEAARAPEGYEDALRNVIDQIPEIVRENPGVETLHIELPEAPGMIGGQRQLVVQVNQQFREQAEKAAGATDET